MRYSLIFIAIGIFSVQGFSQSFPTVTLVFVSTSNDSYKKLEAVIDDVSYYSENTPSDDRNTIWLKNFQPGGHSIKVYSTKNMSNDKRAGNTPLYSSTFTVREGFDAKIAVRSNGQVQFSERISSGNNNSDEGITKKDKNIRSSVNNNRVADNTRKKMNNNKNDNPDNIGKDADKSIAGSDNHNDDTYNNGNTAGNERHSRKRIDTAIVENNSGNNPDNSNRDDTGIDNSNGSNSNRKSDDQNSDNNKAPMDENQFNQLYETIRNQWLPGQKMKTLTNEFLNITDNFTTLQVMQLIRLVTEEGNRLKLAKSSYHCITDPENFSQVDDVLRYQTSRNDLDDFVRDGQD
jgi:hypothetical protein